jgi:hypothetical protein
MKKKTNHDKIQASAAWKVVGTLCAIHNIDTDYRNEESFYNILVKKCFDEAKKEEENSK